MSTLVVSRPANCTDLRSFPELLHTLGLAALTRHFSLVGTSLSTKRDFNDEARHHDPRRNRNSSRNIGIGGADVSGPNGRRVAQDTVNSLQAQGFKVILNRTGSAPLDQCTVSSIRPGQTVVQSSNRDGGRVVQQSYTTVYVQAKC